MKRETERKIGSAIGLVLFVVLITCLLLALIAGTAWVVISVGNDAVNCGEAL